MIPAWTPVLIALAIGVVPARSSRVRLFATSGLPTPDGVIRPSRGPARPRAAARGGPRSRSPWVEAVYRRLGGRTAEPSTEPLNLAAGWDLLAAGLRSGLPVPVTVRAVAAEFTGTAASSLTEVADQLALGADPVSAWEPALRNPGTAELARAARRTARTGSGLAAVADDIAASQRASVGQRSQARMQRAAVWVAAPLGLCFLPAFLCLGVLPVVVGMVEQMRLSW